MCELRCRVRHTTRARPRHYARCVPYTCDVDARHALRGSQRLAIEQWEELLASVVGAIVTTCGEWSGNPRDFYSRSITFTGVRDDVHVTVHLLEHRRGPGDPEQFIDPGPQVALRGAAGVDEVWIAVRQALARVGCVEQDRYDPHAVVVQSPPPMAPPATIPSTPSPPPAPPLATRARAPRPTTPRTKAATDGLPRTWTWKVDGTFNPVYDVCATVEGLAYGCEIQGPFCGYDAVGTQTWDEFLTSGPPDNVQMPDAIADEVCAYAPGRGDGE